MTDDASNATDTGVDPVDGTAAPPTLGYEQARDELIDVVKQLEGGGLTLEQSIALWERGEQLADICQTWLDGARARLDAVTGDESSGAHRAPE
jgi:exodeoxyribonuclease VII small subunit